MFRKADLENGDNIVMIASRNIHIPISVASKCSCNSLYI